MATAATATITEVSPTEATTAGTGNPRIFSEEERQPFAAGVPAQGQSNLAGLQTPDLMNFIDVKIFEKQQRGPAPTISPHLLAATTSEHGKFVTGQNKRNRESNPFQTSFETLMKGGPAGAAKAAGRKSTDDVAPPPAPPVVGAAGKAKRKTRRVSTGDVTEEVRLESKRNRNRLAAKNCRQRKIDKENNLRAQLETLQATHEQLLLRFTKLDSEVAAIQST
eukprot:gene14858-5574_t